MFTRVWNCSTLAISCEELTHWKRLWCWEGLGAGGEGDDRRWDGRMASLTRWTWVWVNSGSWWWTGMSGVLWFMGSQRVRHDWATELNWTELNWTDSNDFMMVSCLYSMIFGASAGDNRIQLLWTTGNCKHVEAWHKAWDVAKTELIWEYNTLPLHVALPSF